MEKNLRPCPFCGGEAEIVRNSAGSYFVRCTNKQCASKTRMYHENENGAIAAWNKRVERTCRIIEDVCGLAHCSECGFEFDPYDCSGIPEEGVPYEYDGRYCKNCGAKVAVE